MPSFDGTNLIITLDSGVTEVDVEQDLYSDWKEFFKTGDNSKFPLAFRTTGGDPLTGSLDLGAYFFLRNDSGWRIRPAEEDATITFVGNLAAEDNTLPLVIPTIGAFTVLILGLQPVSQAVALDTLEKILRNRTETDPDTGVMTVFDDDGVTVLFTANLFEDVAGAQAYRGSGADRRDRLS